jgi:anti-sigma factor RsiW
MQHPDEGTIHSWLDGALSGEEAARLEAHVKECPQCAAAVAEARGFIAAASRILTGLDNVPRGVVPAAAPKKRVDRLVWRVAATVLVVAAGTLVVFRNGVRPERIETVTGSVAPETSSNAKDIRATPEPASPLAFIAKPAQKTASRTQSNGPTVATRERSMNGVTAGETGVTSEAMAAAPPAAQAFTQSPAIGAANRGAARELRLKVVGTPRTLGARVTLYEVAPGDTVTLTEPVTIQLSAIVVTDAATQSMARQSAGKSPVAAAAPMRRADAAAVSALDSQPAAKAIAAPMPVEIANGVTTISWTDPATGSVLKLSGRMPAAQLQEIRLRIERERAAAAAKKAP